MMQIKPNVAYTIWYSLKLSLIAANNNPVKASTQNNEKEILS